MKERVIDLYPFFECLGREGGFFGFFFFSGRQGMSMVGWNGAVIFIVIKDCIAYQRIG
jgi:hypothetical protein